MLLYALLILFFVVCLVTCYNCCHRSKVLRWDWKKIKLEVHFPKHFLWGVATSAHQVEGHCDNNTWHEWEQSVDEHGKKRVEQTAGIACDQWNRYKEDIKLAKELGINTYRFSIEWSKVEPEEGTFDLEAIKHYQNICEELIKNNIKPCVTLHHYVDPIWFAKKGGFEQEENVYYFVRFAKKMFEHLHNQVYIWFTFNAVDSYVIKGWFIGQSPPGKKDIALMTSVYKNVLQAHVHLYREIKETEEGKSAHIGIIKNIHQVDPWCLLNPLDLLGSLLIKKYIDTCFFTFFKTGIFTIYIPFKVNMSYRNHDAIGALDLIGINYFSHHYIKNGKIKVNPDEPSTDNPHYTVYPEGLYRAVKEVSNMLAKPLHIPMYITENGIATTNEDLRDIFLKQNVYALSKAIQDGYDVRGYIYWSLLDCYEWGTYGKKYGLYKVDFKTQERSLKKGSHYYIDVIKQK